MSSTQTHFAGPAGQAAPPMQSGEAHGGELLTPERLAALAEARKLATKVRRAAGVATFNGWGTAIFAALSGLTSLFSLSGLLLAAGMGIVAYFEFDGASRLRRLDLSAPRRLGWNQVFFAALLAGYGLWQIAATLVGPDQYSQMIAEHPELTSQLGPMSGLVRSLMLAIYGSLIVIALTVQGSTAWYYFSRTRHLRKYINETPAWIAQLQRHGVATS